MGHPSAYKQETVHWHPNIPGVKSPDIQFECVTSAGEPTGEFGLTLTGFAEGRPSRLNAVGAAEQRGEWMVATGLRFDQIEPTPANMERMAVEGPIFLAEYFGRGVLPARMRTSSLAAVSLLAAVESPDSFSQASSVAPFPLMNEHLGQLPFISPTSLTRRLEVALLLGVVTPIQLAHRVVGGGVFNMAVSARRELKDYGEERDARLDYGFHPERGQRVADAAVSLIQTHGWFGVFGRSDALVRRGRAAASLRAAAERAGIDPAIVDARIVTAPGPHAPISSPEGLAQFNCLLDGLLQSEVEVEPARPGLLPGLVRQVGALTRRLAA